VSMNLHDGIIRLPLRLDKADVVQDIVTSAAPRFWNGTNVKFQLGFFYGLTLLDLVDFDSVQLQVKDVNSKTGLPYMQKTLSSSSLNNLLSLETWNDGSSQHCEIEFDKTETILPLSSDSTDFWLVVSAIVNDTNAPTAREIVLGAAKITVLESGATYGAPDSVIEPTYLTQAQSDARYLMAIDLTTIEADVATALAQSATAETNAASALATAALAMPLAGGTFTGNVTFAATKTLTLSGVPTSTNHAATKGYVDSQLGGAFVPLNGSVQMTGMLQLVATDPTTANHAVRLSYLSTNFIVKTGATDYTGHQKLFNSTPSDPLHAASKGYVDAGDTAIIGGAPSGLNTLEKIADALGDNTSFSTSVLLLAGGTMTGAINLFTGTTPTGANAIWKSHADATYIKLDGTSGAATGHITLLNSDGTLGSNSAVRKGYVDGVAALYVPLAGGTMTGALNFSGTSHVGIKVNSLTTTQRDALSPSNGSIIYNATSSHFEFREGGTWKQLGSGGGVGLYSQSGSPSGGVGVDGDFDINEVDGTFYKKTSGTWSAITSPSLPISGGTMTGAINFVDMDPSIAWSAGFSVRTLAELGSFSLQLLASGTVWWRFRPDGDFEVMTGYLRVPTGKGLMVNGTVVVTNQQSSIPNYGPGGTADDAGATANSILQALRNHGLIA
jgi:hypothetical protein